MSRGSVVRLAETVVGGIATVLCLVGAPVPWRTFEWRTPIATAVTALLGLLVARVGWRAFQHWRLTRRLVAISQPVQVGGVQVRELPGTRAAFVAGLVRPSIFLGLELTARLTTEELQGVLLHERHHQLHRAPARAVALLALAPLFTRLPAGRRWLARRIAALEIAADRHARSAGASRSALASAILKVQPGPPTGIGFAAAVDDRLRALLDEVAQAPASSLVWMAHGALALAAACWIFGAFR